MLEFCLNLFDPLLLYLILGRLNWMSHIVQEVIFLFLSYSVFISFVTTLYSCLNLQWFVVMYFYHLFFYVLEPNCQYCSTQLNSLSYYLFIFRYYNQFKNIILLSIIENTAKNIKNNCMIKFVLRIEKRG
jgi:hypothetical protein